MNGLLPWVAFIAFILAMLAIDLGIFNRRSHEVKPREALAWVAVWVTLAAIFNAGVYYFAGFEKGLQFTTGYLIEEMLSVDNMFVFVLVMSAFKVPAKNQHKLLFFGIIGALVMRGVLIAAGSWLVHHVHWIFYAFGVFLCFTAFRMLTEDETDINPKENPVVVFISKHIPQLNNPLILALICLELTDLLFALDSIPAIFAVTTDPFIVYTSNVFAILGLRSMYFLLAHAMEQFHLLKYGVSLILAFVGLKMLTKDFVDLPMTWSLAFIVAVIVTSIGMSVIATKRDEIRARNQR